MTKFFWVDTRADAQTDANEKGLTNWQFFADKQSIGNKDLLEYDAVYFRAGINELEKEFARIMSSSWPC